MPNWYVYVLRSIEKKYFYIGSTNNLQRRLNEHNGGLVTSTRPYRPYRIVAYVAVETEQKAREL